MTNPLRDRFGIVSRLEFYTADELARIVQRSASLLNVPADKEGDLKLHDDHAVLLELPTDCYVVCVISQM